MSGKQVFTIVHPMQQIDDLETINNRIEALIEASYDLFGELHSGSCNLNKEQAIPLLRAADRGMILLGIARDLLAQSQNGLVKEYRQLAELGLANLERAA